ncbi:MAG: hypothetical protein ABIO70_14135 [Pseudomonadota bacterium]
MSTEKSESRRRLRVVLVRWPPGGNAALARVLPRRHVPRRDALPVVVRVTEDRAKAEETAARLEGAGAGVVVLEEFAHVPVVCAEHPPELVRASCRRCAADLCAACILDADGERLCRRCARESGARTQRIHTRQLFVVFLFCAFLYQVYALWKRDTDLRTGGETIPVALLQFVAPGAEDAPAVRGLSGLDPRHWSGPTYADIASFFDRERERYTGHRAATLALSVRGPWVEQPRSPVLPGEADTAFGLGLSALRYSWFWRRLAVRHGVDLRRFSLRLFVIFTDQAGDEAANSRAARGGHLAVSYVSITDPNPAYPAITIAHELCHLLGSSDKYGQDGLAVYPQGYVEPHLDPLFPQRFGELMAVDIPVGREQEREPTSLDQIRIGFQTAAEIGWITEDQASSFYRGAGPDPEALLPPIEQPEEAPPPTTAPTENDADAVVPAWE